MTVLAFAILFVTNGFTLAGLTVFDRQMISEFHVSVAAWRVRDTITVLVLGLSVPLVGHSIDRFPVRPVLIIGLLLCAAAFLTYGHVHRVWQVYALHAVLGLSEATSGSVACVYLISGWTRVHRGAALGVLIAGSSLGNALAPTINAALLKIWPWREVINAGGVFSLVLIPLVILVVRQPPFDPASAVQLDDPERGEEAPLVSVLRSTSFWLLCGVAGTTVFGVLALATNLALFAAREPASLAVSGPALLFYLFGAAVTAQVAAGLATYKVGTRVIHALALIAMFIAAVAFALAPANALTLPIVLFGLGWGANSTMLQVRPTLLFPNAMRGKVLAFLAIAETMGGGFGPFVSGYTIDRFNFTAAFVLVSAVLLVPAVLGLAFPRANPAAP